MNNFMIYENDVEEPLQERDFERDLFSETAQMMRFYRISKGYQVDDYEEHFAYMRRWIGRHLFCLLSCSMLLWLDLELMPERATNKFYASQRNSTVQLIYCIMVESGIGLLLAVMFVWRPRLMLVNRLNSAAVILSLITGVFAILQGTELIFDEVIALSDSERPYAAETALNLIVTIVRVSAQLMLALLLILVCSAKFYYRGLTRCIKKVAKLFEEPLIQRTWRSN